MNKSSPGKIRSYDPNSVYQNKELEIFRNLEGRDGWIVFMSPEKKHPIKLSISRWQFIDHHGKKHNFHLQYILAVDALNLVSLTDSDVCLVLFREEHLRDTLKIVDAYDIHIYNRYDLK